MQYFWNYPFYTHQYFLGVRCVPTDESPFYNCLGCPAGSSGNGTQCRDLDEVILQDKVPYNELIIFAGISVWLGTTMWSISTMS